MTAGRRARITLALGLLVVLCAILVATPLIAEANSINSCLSPCHGGIGIAPDVESAYAGGGDSAGHKMTWNPRIVADASGAVYPQNSRMPCGECHAAHGAPTSSIYSFSEARTGAPITEVRQLCEGCHRPYDSVAATPTVCGLVMAKLPSGPAAHADADTTPCSTCHGATAHSPEGHSGGGSCGDGACHGGSGSHAIHLSDTDPRGPGDLGCYACHETDNIPKFASGSDTSGNGSIELDETDVCDECHSPGGDYDGVDSATAPSGAMSIGAKDNWSDKVYATANALQSGKGRWCAGCHDGDSSVSGEEPSLVDGVYAPPVVGDEDDSYIYGTGWGYYETGHGVASTAVLPSNGYAAGPELACDDCHDYGLAHIDGERRTHDAGSSSAGYRTSYRLDLISSANPMEIPWAAGAANDATRARLCYQSGCHSYSQINNTASQETNFWLSSGVYYYNAWRYNMHEFHLDFDNQLRWVSDYTSNAYPGDSQISCPTCHNVHGSQYLAMTRDGELTSEVYNRKPGLRMWYRNSAVSVWNPSDANPPAPQDIPMAASDGWIWRPATASAVCSHCHGANQNTRDFDRNLWQSFGIAPVLSWTGETGYANDGADPDSGTAEDTFTFRVEYADGNNDAPTFVTLRIDRNDDGDCDDTSETVTMDPVDALDITYYNGNFYTVDVALAKAGDSVLPYHFEASDGVSGTSLSETQTVTVSNAPPQLPWTGEAGYSDDGVSPNSGTTGVTNYEFRILYKDPDGEAPTGGAPTLYVDKNDDGDYGDAGETVTMAPMAGGDYINGKRYNHSSTLTYNIDGLVPYYFEAGDGTAVSQSAVSTVTVLENVNQAPTLSWTAEPGYGSDGVDPENQAGGKPFYFRIEYTDANGDAPGTAQVWIDLDDDTVYEAGEKFAMDDSVTSTDTTKVDADYSNGEYYAEKVYVPFPSSGDGVIPYTFYFTDSSAAEATGEPQDDGGDQSDDKTLTVFNALDVPSEYGTIQDAIDNAGNGQTVLVDDGTYGAISFDANKDITVTSVNGAGSTTLTAGGTVVSYNNGSDSTLDGFSVVNGTTGVYSNNSNVTITNCVIDNMSANGIQHQSGGTYLLLVEDSTISGCSPAIKGNNGGGRITVHGSTLTGNTGGNGGAIESNGASLYTFEESVFSNNTASANGGALYNVSSTFTMVASDCVFEGNRANGGYGGALAFNNATTVTLERCIVRGNYSSGDGGGVRQGNGTYNYTNTTFSGNYAGGNGGAVCAPQNGGVPTFDYCTISGNSANAAGAIWVWWHNPGVVKVKNSILYGDDSRSSATLDEIDGGGYDRTWVLYTDINQATTFNSQTGKYTLPPSFVSAVAASNAPTTTGDYHLQTGSSCEGKADPASTVTDDIDRGTRPQGTGRDSGSDEIGAAAAMKFGPVGGSLAVPSEETSHTGPPTLPAPPVAEMRVDDSGFLLVGSTDPLARNTVARASSSKGIGTDGGFGASQEPLGMPEPTLPAAALGFASMLALAWKAFVRVF